MGDLTLIGLEGAFLDGVQIVFQSLSNVIIRNLKLTGPTDCVPEIESPGSWNARYDAITLANATKFWVDGNTFQDGPAPIIRDELGLWGWDVLRHDGMFDVRLGSDSITLSHNILQNHHKTCLFGGSAKDASKDKGKMHFTLFANHWHKVESRNPMVRHGTFYLINNLYTQEADKPPYYDLADPGKFQNVSDALPTFASKYVPEFLDNIAVDNFASVLLGGNVFTVGGKYAEDQTRLLRFSNVKDPATPAKVCVPAKAGDGDGVDQLGAPSDSFNGKEIDMQVNALGNFEYWAMRGKVAPSAIKATCEGFKLQEMPKTFQTPKEVEAYVKAQAGQSV